MHSTNGSTGSWPRTEDELVSGGLLGHPQPGDHDYEEDDSEPPPPPPPPPDFPGDDDDPPSPRGKKPPSGDERR